VEKASQQGDRRVADPEAVEARTGEGSESALIRLKNIERDRQLAEPVR
jgi:hypothetical protein